VQFIPNCTENNYIAYMYVLQQSYSSICVFSNLENYEEFCLKHTNEVS